MYFKVNSLICVFSLKSPVVYESGNVLMGVLPYYLFGFMSLLFFFLRDSLNSGVPLDDVRALYISLLSSI